VIRDTHGREITAEEGRKIVREHHQLDPRTRDNAAHRRQSQRLKGRTGREQKASPTAPASRPAEHQPTNAKVA
jgi:hypothetical protein